MVNNTSATHQKIEAARVGTEYSRNQLSTRTGIPYTTLTRKLNGISDFTVGEIGRIADALGVPPWDLLPDEFLEEAGHGD